MVSHTLVLIHGLGASAQQFTGLQNMARGASRLICVNMPGHADNFCAHPERSASFDTFTDLLVRFCDRQGIRDAVFCGISMGSALSLRVAAARPDLCRAVIAVRPAWLTEAAPQNLSLIGRIGDLFTWHDAPQVLEQLRADAQFREIAQDVPKAADSIVAAITRDHAYRHAPVLTAMYRDRPFRRLTELREVRCPVRVVGTNADALHPVELAHQTANALPDAQLDILPPRYLEPQAHERALKRLIGDVIAGCDAASNGERDDYETS